MIKALIFDLDDTLFPENEYVMSGLKAVGNYVSRYYSKSDFLEIAKKYYEDGLRGEIFNKSLKKLGLSYSENMIKQLVKVYREHLPNIKLYDDAKWAINFFKDVKQLGIITDGYLEIQKKKLPPLQLKINLT